MRLNINNILKLFLFLSTSFIFSCKEQLTNPSQDSYIIKTGTSFSYCYGYCRKELAIDGLKLRYLHKSNDRDFFPSFTYFDSLSTKEYETLMKYVNEIDFTALENVYGCPDCNDGGSEWIEINTPTTRKKVLFEFGAVIEPIKYLQSSLREIRKNLDSKLGK